MLPGVDIDSPLLACPQCGGQLAEQQTPEESVTCVACSELWPIDEEGVVRLAPDSPGTNERDDQFLQRLKQTPKDELFGSLADAYPDRYGRYVDPRQSDWWLLGNVPNGIVLDASNGCGSLSPIVAQQARAILVVDADLCRVTTAAILAEKFGLETILAVHAPADVLPIRPGMIDRAFLTGLSPLGKSNTGRVNRIRELLVDGGELHVRVQNRYSVRELGRDPFGRIEESLRRLLSSSGLIPTNRSAGIENVLSRREASHRLTEAGFTDIEVGYGVPDAWRPQYLYSGPEALARYLRNILRQRYLHRSRLTLSALRIGAQVFARSGLAGATAPALFLRATWIDD